MVQTLSFLLVVFCFVVVSLGQASNPPLWPSCQDGAFCNTDIQNGTEHVQRIIYPDGTVTLNSCQHVPYIGDVCFDISISPLGSFYDNIVIQLTIDSLKVWTLNTTIPDIIIQDGVCVDGDTILEILEMQPSMAPYRQLFFQILKVTGCLPGGLFNLCITFDPCTTSAVPAGLGKAGSHVEKIPQLSCGCFVFIVELLYFENYCLYNGQFNIGCIN